jgi:hypothetical protein
MNATLPITTERAPPFYGDIPTNVVDARPGLREFIFESAGYALVECEIAQKLCEIGSDARLKEAVEHLVSCARAIAKSYRELEALNAAARAGDGSDS